MSATSLPIVGQPAETPFLLNAALQALAPGVLASSRRAAQNARLELGAALGSLRPVLCSGPWLEFLQARQQLRRATLLREAGLPEAGDYLFISRS